MSRNIEVLNQRLIGYNKKQVEQFIDEINIAHQKTVNFLQDSIENHRQEKERLLSELSMIKKISKGNEESIELLEFALKRAVKTIAVINKTTEEDVEKIIENAKNKILIHEKQAQDLERNMEDQRTEIDQLLIKVQLLFSVQEKGGNIEEKQEGKDETRISKIHVAASKSSNTNANLERLLTSNDWQKIIKPLTKGKFENASPDNMENVKSESEKITADGSSLSNLKSFSETKAQVDSPKKHEKSIKNELKADNFWEDWDDPTRKEINLPKLNNVVQLPGDIFTREKLKESSLRENIYKDANNDLKSSFHDDEKDNLKDEEKSDLIEERINEALNKEELTEGIKSNGIIPDKEESTVQHIEDTVANMISGESSKGSPSVTKEIENIRQKYMVGKIAGADLLDQKGNLIISKNSVISPEVVKKAEKEGKLVELILNMSFPGIEE